MKKIYLIATIVAIITGVAVFLFAAQLQSGSTQIAQTNMVAVVVAAQDIAENTTITEEMLVTVMFPENTVPSTAVKDSNYLINKIAKYPVIKGEQFLVNKILVIGDIENKELSDRIKEGYRAYTLSVDAINGVAGYLKIGDNIDIIITRSIDGIIETRYSLQNINIIAIGNSSQYIGNVTTITEYSNITLEISAEDCVLLTHEINSGIAKVVLRGFGDNSVVEKSGIIDEISQESEAEISTESN